MPGDFECNELTRIAEVFHKSGNYASRMMKWMVVANFHEKVHYYGIIAAALAFMNVEKYIFSLANGTDLRFRL